MTTANSKATITTPRPRIYMRSRIKVFKNTSRTKFRVGTVMQRNSLYRYNLRFDGDETDEEADFEDLTTWEFVEKDPEKRNRQRLQALARARLEGKIPYRNYVPTPIRPGFSQVTRSNPVISSNTPNTFLQGSDTTAETRLQQSDRAVLPSDQIVTPSSTALQSSNSKDSKDQGCETEVGSSTAPANQVVALPSPVLQKSDNQNEANQPEAGSSDHNA